jgi:hypothetical protein
LPDVVKNHYGLGDDADTNDKSDIPKAALLQVYNGMDASR